MLLSPSIGLFFKTGILPIGCAMMFSLPPFNLNLVHETNGLSGVLHLLFQSLCSNVTIESPLRPIPNGGHKSEPFHLFPVPFNKTLALG